MESSLVDRVRNMIQLLVDAEKDAQKSDDGVISAGTRARKHLQTVRKAAQDARAFCQQRDHERKPPKTK